MTSQDQNTYIPSKVSTTDTYHMKTYTVRNHLWVYVRCALSTLEAKCMYIWGGMYAFYPKDTCSKSTKYQVNAKWRLETTLVWPLIPCSPHKHCNTWKLRMVHQKTLCLLRCPDRLNIILDEPLPLATQRDVDRNIKYQYTTVHTNMHTIGRDIISSSTKQASTRKQR